MTDQENQNAGVEVKTKQVPATRKGARLPKSVNQIKLEDLFRNFSDRKKELDIQEVSPKDKLKFAGQSLLFIGVVFAVAAGNYTFVDNEPSKEIFEFCKTALPPIVMLIFGAYFSKGDS